MDLASAKLVLNDCERQELRDHAFGDVEVYWFMQGHEIAGGYFGRGRYEVWLTPKSTFNGNDALELRKCGKEGIVARNDETGPDEFELGKVMPGLDREGVRQELMQR